MRVCLVLAAVLGLVRAAPAEERVPYTSAAGNYKLTYPASMRPVKSAPAMFQLALRRGGDAVLVSALESNTTVEEMLEDYREQVKLESEEVKEIARRRLRVGGEKALLLHLAVKYQGVRGSLYAALFTHQGIVYRVIGVRMLGKAEALTAASASPPSGSSSAWSAASPTA